MAGGGPTSDHPSTTFMHEHGINSSLLDGADMNLNGSLDEQSYNSKQFAAPSTKHYESNAYTNTSIQEGNDGMSSL